MRRTNYGPSGGSFMVACRLVTGEPPAGAHDLTAVSLAALKSTVIDGPACNHVLIGFRVEVTALFEFVGQLFVGDYEGTGDGRSLVVVAEDNSTNTYVALATIGGESNEIDPLGAPSASTIAGVVEGSAFGASIVAPRFRVYTSGAARIVGEVDLAELTYPDDLDGQTFSFTSDTGSAVGSFNNPLSPQDVADQITAAGSGNAFAYINSDGHLVVFSASRDANGSISTPDDATATLLGFDGGASKIDGRPTFGDIDPDVAADITIKILLSEEVISYA